MNSAQFLVSNELYLIGNGGKHNYKADCIFYGSCPENTVKLSREKKKLMTKHDDKDRDDVADFISYWAVVITLQRRTKVGWKYCPIKKQPSADHYMQL